MRHPTVLACLFTALLLPMVPACTAQQEEIPSQPPNSTPAPASSPRAGTIASSAPAEGAGVAHFPFLTVDVKHKQIRVDCEALHVDAPLEFFCCVTGTNEYESVLRSKVRPSHLHAALLMLGLKPGEPVHFSEAAQKWIPPHGPPLHISVEFDKNGKHVSMPAYRLMRDDKTKKPMPPMTWIFAGSRLIKAPDGSEIYAADRTGYLVTVVNFELSVIDIPELASSANETLEWETNLDEMPPKGTPVTMIIEPAGQVKQNAVFDPSTYTGPMTVPPLTQEQRSAVLQYRREEYKRRHAQATAPAAPTTHAGVVPDVAAADDHARAAQAGPIDQPLVTIDAAGHIALDSVPVASVDELIGRLGKTSAAAARRVRVAVANPIEDNPAARQVLNALSRNRIDFTAVPQATAAGLMSPGGRSPIPAEATTAPTAATSQDRADDELIRRLRTKWDQAVAPRSAELRQAAQAHYEVINQLRQEQHRLIDEADKVQRLIDQLEKEYQDMTTPGPQ